MSKSAKVVLGREPINSEWLADVRFGAHSGLKSDITALPKCATSRHRPLFKAVGQTLRPQSTQKESAAEWMSPSSWATG